MTLIQTQLQCFSYLPSHQTNAVLLSHGINKTGGESCNKYYVQTVCNRCAQYGVLFTTGIRIRLTNYSFVIKRVRTDVMSNSPLVVNIVPPVGLSCTHAYTQIMCVFQVTKPHCCYIGSWMNFLNP